MRMFNDAKGYSEWARWMADRCPTATHNVTIFDASRKVGATILNASDEDRALEHLAWEGRA